MIFGLDSSDLEYIINVIKGFSEVDKAVIFGSRAKGNYRLGSDVDIAVFGEDINLDTVSSIKYKLEEEGPLPYLFDIIDYTHLNNRELKEHIDRVGKIIYKKNY